MSAKSMKDLEKPIGGAIFTNAFLSIAILFIVVGSLFEVINKNPSYVLVIMPLTLAVMYAIARTTPMYIYKIYTIPAGGLIVLCFFAFLVWASKLIGFTTTGNSSGNYLGFLALALTVYILYYIAKKGNKVFRAKYEKRFAAEAAQVAAEASKFKTCPHCAETILVEAKVCKHCGRDV